MRGLSKLITPLFTSALVAVSGSAIAGAALLWLQSKEIDPALLIFNAIELAQSEKNQKFFVIGLLLALTLIVVVVVRSLKIAFENSRRPSIQLVKNLRVILLDMREFTLSMTPDEQRSNLLIKRLRIVSFELATHPDFTSKLQLIEDLSEDYLTRVSPGYIVSDETEIKIIASLHSQALEKVQQLLHETRWAAF
jgi:hypothetical protein